MNSRPIPVRFFFVSFHLLRPFHSNPFFGASFLIETANLEPRALLVYAPHVPGRADPRPAFRFIHISTSSITKSRWKRSVWTCIDSAGRRRIVPKLPRRLIRAAGRDFVDTHLHASRQLHVECQSAGHTVAPQHLKNMQMTSS